jgi:hypothetical protein
MFGPRHYVPILRWKQAERFALQFLREEDRKNITPLIEITPRVFDAPEKGKRQDKKPDPGEVLEDQAKKLLESWGNAPFLLDLGLVDASATPVGGVRHPLAHIAETARNFRLSMIPVTALGRRDEYQTAVSDIVKQDGRGTCLRLFPREVLQPTFAKKVKSFLRRFELDESKVDLLLDYQTFAHDNPDLRSLLGRVPDLRAWRSLTFASGAFPMDLQRFPKGWTRVVREDWLSWKAQFFDETSVHSRTSFSDYTIQWGQYKEPVEYCNPSVSVRYTLEKEWLVLRGEAPGRKPTSKETERRPGLEQWYGHAQLLCENAEAFYGEHYSWGDNYIFEKSLRKGKPGGYETWLRAGINHHMTVVSRQLASLAVP